MNRLPLDPERIENARRRAASALAVAKFHEGQAASARSTADTLARTWGFSLSELSAGDEVDSLARSL